MGKQWKQWETLFSWAPTSLQMMTAAMKFRHLPIGRKAMTNLDNILKSRDITLPTKVHLVKAVVSPVVMYGCENWTIKKSEHWRINVFELWCWRRLLSVPKTSRRSNQSIIKEISPEYSLEGLMLKLKFQYFGHLMRRADSVEKTLMLGKIEGRRRRGQQRMTSGKLNYEAVLTGGQFSVAKMEGALWKDLLMFWYTYMFCCHPWFLAKSFQNLYNFLSDRGEKSILCWSSPFQPHWRLC